MSVIRTVIYTYIYIYQAGILYVSYSYVYIHIYIFLVGFLHSQFFFLAGCQNISMSCLGDH